MRSLFVFIALLTISATLMAQTAIEPTIGNGTQNDPYQIESLENLYWIAASTTRWGFHYIQTADIDASSTSAWFAGQGWTPIGTTITNHFSGSYDGQNHAIEGLFINRPTTDYIGFIGIEHGAVIENLRLTNVNFVGQTYVGGIVGRSRLSSIVRYCYSTGVVNGNSHVGGVVGRNCSASTVSSCYSTVNVTGNNLVGGLVGENVNSSPIHNSYSRGNVTGGSNTGGLVGWNSSTTITNSFSTGAVSGSSGVGGLIGYNATSTVSNSYWDINTSGQTTSAAGLARSTGDMTYPYASNTYVGWDFVDIWQEDPLYLNDGYPYLEWQTFEIYPEAEAPTAGDGTPSNPYEISSLENLYWIAASEDIVPDPDQATRWSSHYIQIADIDASSTSGWFSGQGWTPIGDNSDNSNETRFTGTYYGQDYTINGLFINRLDVDHVGLFGYASGSLLENIGISDVNINGHYFAGGLVGMTESYTLISNCFSDGIVSGDYYVGGLVGAHTFHSTISNSYSSCSVSGHSEVGGLSGRTAQATHSNSYSIGSVDGNSYVGGFIGRDLGYCTIVNCYSKGSVNGISWVGGFIGHQFGTTFTNCYWDMETSGQPSSAAGEGRTTEEMTYTYAANTYVDWDFINTWKADPQYLNDGYPYLHWQDSGLDIMPPENLVTNIDEGSIYLNWEVVENANSYKVYASDDPYSEDWQLIDIVDEPVFSETISGAMKFYRIVASTETID